MVIPRAGTGRALAGSLSGALLGIGAMACANVLGLDAYRERGGDGGPDGCAAGDAGPCSVVPADWTLVAYAAASEPPCPAGFAKGTPVDLVGSPSAAAGACTCDSCTVTASPSCVTGPIAFGFDTNQTSTCATAGTLANANAGACNPLMPKASITASYDARFTPLAATGGTCAAGPPSSHPDRVTFSQQGRLCPVDDGAAAGCITAPCAPAISAPFAACLEHAGSVPCPAGPFAVAHPVGTGAASVSCSDTCACSVAARCDKATVTYYQDAACKSATTLMSPANGTCMTQGGSGLMYGSYTYSADTVPSCSAAGSAPTGIPPLAGEQTICCAE
jgi:hypothetical protein